MIDPPSHQSTTAPPSPEIVETKRGGGFLPDAFSSSNRRLSAAGQNDSMYGQLVKFDDDDDSNDFDDLDTQPFQMPAGGVLLDGFDEEQQQQQLYENSNGVINCSDVEHQILLYLIRHGEAEHNIEEKKAMAEAKRKAFEEEGLEEDDPRVQERMEAARKAVLNDEMLRDAKLSAQGKQEARQARDKLQALLQEDNGLDQPDYVLVSPLTRTLETCDIIFPDNNNIHVRDEISERHTGKPADTPSPVHRLSLRPSFQRFSMDQLREAAQVTKTKKKARTVRRSSFGGDESSSTKPSMAKEQLRMSHSISQPEIFLMHDELFRGAPDDTTNITEEDKAELRKRTENLFALLCASNSFSVAVVTHKGYLRELERGPFNQPEAALFKNCEFRVYRITMRNQKLVKAERVPV